jgi:pyruvate,water dikinase
MSLLIILSDLILTKFKYIHLAHGHVLTGLGVAAGKAKLIRHPCENSRLQSGDVLVAPSTDSGWTLLFLRAKALVMEVDG